MTDEREVFEKWVKDNHAYLCLYRGKLGTYESRTVDRMWEGWKAARTSILAGAPDVAAALREAENLAKALHAKHFREVTQWKPFSGDLVGLLLQIDNMTAGLSRATHASPPPPAEGEGARSRDAMDALRALYEWYDRDGSVGGAADVFEDHRRILSAFELAQVEVPSGLWERQAKDAASIIAMIRAMIGEMFGPIASIESADATLLRGPEARHDGQAILEALGRVRDTLSVSQVKGEPVAWLFEDSPPGNNGHFEPAVSLSKPQYSGVRNLRPLYTRPSLDAFKAGAEAMRNCIIKAIASRAPELSGPNYGLASEKERRDMREDCERAYEIIDFISALPLPSSGEG